jgi:hypothetical protein
MFGSYFTLPMWLLPSMYTFRAVINVIFEIMITYFLDFLEFDTWCWKVLPSAIYQESNRTSLWLMIYEVVIYRIYYGVPAAQLAYMRSSLTGYVNAMRLRRFDIAKQSLQCGLMMRLRSGCEET